MNSCSKAPRGGPGTAHRRYWPWLGCLLLFGLSVHAEPWPVATNLWTFAFGYPPMPILETLSTPAVAADGTIYVGTFLGKLLAISPDGKEQWSFQAGREIKSSPAVGDDGTIYFGSRDHQFYAVTPAGRLKWKFPTGAWVDSSAAIATDGTIYFGSWDKNFYALNPDGSLKWKFAVGGIVDSSPAVAADGTVYFGAHNKKFYALDTGGKPRWTFLTGAEITASPAIGSDGSVYCGSTDGNLYRLGADGREIWRCRTGSGADGSPVLAENGNVIIAAAYKTLIISPAGAVIWSRASEQWIDQTPVVAGGMVCFTSPGGTFMAAQFDGTTLWWAHVTWDPTSSPVINREGQIYFCNWISLQAWQPPMPLLPANTPWPMFRADSRHTGRVGKVETSP